MRTLSALLIFAAAIASRAPAFAADPFPASGAAKLAAYSVCRSAVMVDMGPVGSNSSAECTGIVKTRDGSKLLDNLAIRCMEELQARPAGYAFTGACIQTDGDGDKIFMTYEGPEGGVIALLGGTGKYQGITGKGTWSVVDAPGNNAQLFAFTLSYDVNVERQRGSEDGRGQRLIVACVRSGGRRAERRRLSGTRRGNYALGRMHFDTMPP